MSKLKLITKAPHCIIYDAQQVFELCKGILGDEISRVMYMFSTDESTHHFKRSIERTYFVVDQGSK